MITKIKSLLAVVALSLSSVACSTVPAGHVGVKVYLLGGSKGVDSEVLGLGRYYIGMNEELYLFPTFQQNYTWLNPCPPGSQEATRNGEDCKVPDESISFQTSEGMVVNADVGISYSLDPAKIPQIFQKYRKGIDEITDLFLRNHVRDAMNSVGSKAQVEDVYGQGKDRFMTEVQKQVVSQVQDIGIIIDKIYLLGSLRLPQGVIAALNAKMEATQKAQQRQNEVAEAEAQAKKQFAGAEGEAKSLLLVAEAQAKANKVIADSITPELVQYEYVKKWNGVKSTTVVSGAGNGTGVLLDLK